MVGKDENETTELWRPPKEKDLAKGTAKLSLCLLPPMSSLLYFGIFYSCKRQSVELQSKPGPNSIKNFSLI